MRIRLLVGLAAAAALLGLTACRSSPEVAAYVGDTVFTEQQVTDLVNGFNAQAPDEAEISRMTVLQYLVSEQLCQRLSQERGFDFETRPVQHGAPDFLSVASRLEGCVDAIPASAKPTDDELRDLHRRVVASGNLPPGSKFEDVRQDWQGDQQLQVLLGRQKAMKQAAEAADVTINPRYQDLTIPVLNQQIAERLGKPGSGAVVEAPRQPATPQGQ